MRAETVIGTASGDTLRGDTLRGAMHCDSLSSQDATFAANRARGRIRLAAALRSGATWRTAVYEEGSLRVRFPAPARPTAGLDAVLVNTAGGIAGGDTADIEVTVAAGADLRITTASAEKVYRSHGPAAAVAVRLAVGAGARLAWLPRETILFDRARLDRIIEVDLAADARLVLAEAVVFGRAGMDEVVTHGRLVDRWRVRRDGRLLHAEGLRLDGAVAARLAEPAVAAGGIALATLLTVPADEALVAAVQGGAVPLAGEAGASSWNGRSAVRFCAPDGETLRRDLTAVLTVALAGALPPLWTN
ncbi:Urease accessory protein UreD [Rhodoplanes serenus]|uniref:Urease accessory protein UreD n=2 Tax=Nitrobacteraceae TaxID=41294 RepID=A0A3S4FCP9_9BRAD|nr:Urease accessory protein UreD [Rhodoplanes serenus]